jgi:NAD(P)-dependent dehydrogenase (short-subunit alcohol dehydrogenase family)
MTSSSDSEHPRVVVVTGASGGLGSVMARRFAEGGDTVFIGYRSQSEKADALVAELNAEGHTTHPLLLELSSPDSVAGALAAAVETAGPINVLINNAAYRPIGPFLEIPDSQWEEVLSVNILGAARCCRAVLPGMIEQRFGRIINISGLDALHGGFGRSHVAVSKAGLMGLSRAIAVEFGHLGVTANTVIPGSFRVWRDPKLYPNWEEMRKFLVSHTTVRRQGEPDELAELCWYLSSSAAAYITGQDIHINGGSFPLMVNPFLEAEDQ